MLVNAINSPRQEYGREPRTSRLGMHHIPHRARNIFKNWKNIYATNIARRKRFCLMSAFTDQSLEGAPCMSTRQRSPADLRAMPASEVPAPTSISPRALPRYSMSPFCSFCCCCTESDQKLASREVRKLRVAEPWMLRLGTAL